MEVFLERLLIELLFIAAQLAILRLVAWFKDRISPVDAVGAAA